MNANVTIWLCVAFVWLMAGIAGYIWTRRHRRIWIAHAYYGAGRLSLGTMTRARALQLTAKTLGTVTFVDDERGFIFYKPHSENRS